MALPEYRWVSVEEYLAIDNASDVRFEYVHGQLRMLAGGSRNYALIAHNLHGYSTTTCVELHAQPTPLICAFR